MTAAFGPLWTKLWYFSQKEIHPLYVGVLDPDSYSPNLAGFDSHQFDEFFLMKENAVNLTTNPQMLMTKTVSCLHLFQFTFYFDF